MILEQLDDGFVVQCVCSEVYFSSKEDNTKVFNGVNYPICPSCGKREGIANMENVSA